MGKNVDMAWMSDRERERPYTCLLPQILFKLSFVTKPPELKLIPDIRVAKSAFFPRNWATF